MDCREAVTRLVVGSSEFQAQALNNSKSPVVLSNGTTIVQMSLVVLFIAEAHARLEHARQLPW